MTLILILAVLFLPQRPAVPLAEGAVSGRILTSAGAPAAGVRVGALDTTNTPSSEPALMSIGVTGADGRYRLEGLPAGRYTIVAGPFALPTYYPGGTALSSASTVTVSPGTTVTDRDFSLARATEGFKVSGRFIWRERKREAVVQLIDPEGFRAESSIRLAADDTFEIKPVYPGTYLLMATVPLENGGNWPIVITVRNEDVSGIEIVIPRIVEVSGIAIAEDGSFLPPLTIAFAPGGLLMRQETNTETETDGTFQTKLPEGEYRLRSNLPRGYYFKSLTAGSMDLLREPLKVTGADSRIRVVAVLARAAPAQVSGRVTAPAGSPLPTRIELMGMTVRNPPTTAPIRPDGTFAISGVMPGMYRPSLSLDSGLRIPAALLAVPERDLTDVGIAAPPLTEIVGRVSVVGNGPLTTGDRLWLSRGSAQNLQIVAAMSVTLSPFISGAGVSPQSVFPEIDTAVIPLPPGGTFRFALPEGEYQVAFLGARNIGSPRAESLYDVSEMTFGGANLLIEPMRLARTNSAELRVTLAPNPRTPRFKVSGRVLGVAPDVQRATRVNLSGGNLAPLEAPVAADGSFEFSEIPRGEYTARVTPGNVRTPTPQVQVNDKDVSGVAIRIPVVREIQGRITVEGGGPPIGFSLVLEGNDGPVTIAANPRPDGTFQVTVPEGAFRVRLNRLPGGYGIKSLTYGTTDLLFDPLVVTRVASELRATLETGPALPKVRVRGRVTGVNPAEVTRVRLTGMDAATTFEGPLTEGLFDISGPPPGVYLVSLLRGGDPLVVEPPIIAVALGNRPGVTLSVAPTTPPAILEARRTANETAAVANLRTIITAQVTYLSTSGGEYGDLRELIEAGLIDSRFEGPISGYVYSISAWGGDYVAAAAPVNVQSGRHGFFSTPDGVVRFAVPEQLSPPGQSGAPVQ